jgi:hypothetical protein
MFRSSGAGEEPIDNDDRGEGSGELDARHDRKFGSGNAAEECIDDRGDADAERKGYELSRKTEAPPDGRNDKAEADKKRTDGKGQRRALRRVAVSQACGLAPFN